MRGLLGAACGMRPATDEWTETSRYVDDVGVVHATFARTFGDNTKWLVCPALREPGRIEISKDNPITCITCLAQQGG